MFCKKNVDMHILQSGLMEKFIFRLKQEKTLEEIEKYVDNLAEYDLVEVYFLMLCFLKEEDLLVIERISDERVLEQELDRRFKLRTGFTPREFIENIKNKFTHDTF